MRSSLVLAFSFVALASIACSGDAGEGASAGSGSKPGEARERDQPSEPASASKPSERVEIITDEVFRPAKTDALLVLPREGMPEGWTTTYLHKAGISGVQMFRGTPSDFTGFITIMFFPPIEPAPSAAKMLEQFESMMSGGMPHLAPQGEPAPFEPGGLARTRAGTSESGVAERAWLGVIVEGSAAVGVLVRGAEQVFEPQLQAMAKQLLAGLRVGKAVPHLPDREPSLALAGVWECLAGLRVDWVLFDPRGYAVFAPPEDPSWLDLDVDLALGRSVYAYRVEGDEIVFEPTPPDPDRVVRRWKFARKGEAIVLDGDEYRRIDEAPVELRPGSWEYYYSSNVGGFSSDEAAYAIAADGTYTYTSSFSYAMNQPDLDRPGELEWSAAGYASQQPSKGRFSIVGHELRLDDGKTKALRSIYRSKHSDEVVYIAGQKFVKMK